jgi:tetratricopeptide (TPR) repeat protein
LFLDVLNISSGDESVSFASRFDSATNLLNDRRINEAISGYEAAIKESETDSERQQAWHMKGISFRVAGLFEQAYVAFEESIKLCATRADEARVRRDKAMALLDDFTHNGRDIQRFNVAVRELTISMSDLSSCGMHIEAAVSLSFMGRAYLLEGNRARAQRTFAKAHEVLADTSCTDHNVQYELNNLIWMARSSVKFRLLYALRALEICRQQDQPKRWKEYLIILIGGDVLYRYVSEKE